jgi:hypothetical protein
MSCCSGRISRIGSGLCNRSCNRFAYGPLPKRLHQLCCVLLGLPLPLGQPSTFTLVLIPASDLVAVVLRKADYFNPTVWVSLCWVFIRNIAWMHAVRVWPLGGPTVWPKRAIAFFATPGNNSASLLCSRIPPSGPSERGPYGYGTGRDHPAATSLAARRQGPRSSVSSCCLSSAKNRRLLLDSRISMAPLCLLVPEVVVRSSS